ncbi:hypothetical protein [Piscinibacter sp.]|uniref:hypothetical protein n=1 Tax=Piscinibacter sp. TaxID=1903157 RepID=UPI00355A9CE1
MKDRQEFVGALRCALERGAQAACFVLLCASLARAAGVPVQVTPEMTGAGMVSSGVELPTIPPPTGNRKNPVPSWGKPLPYPIVIADRRNNRLIEVTPDKRIVWEFPSPNLKVYRGNEDVNFSADGRQLAVSEEDNYDVHLVDYERRVITWTYGVPDTRGSQGTLLNYPDDAHLLADGKFLTADIRNCRVLIIDPKDSSIVTQWGRPGQCRHNPPQQLAYPNGATPLDNGDILVVDDLHDRVIDRPD